MLLLFPTDKNKCYFFQIEHYIAAVFVEVRQVVLLVVKPDAGFLFAHAVILDGAQQINLLINYNFVLDVWIFLVLQIEVVLGELINLQVGSADLASHG